MPRLTLFLFLLAATFGCGTSSNDAGTSVPTPEEQKAILDRVNQNQQGEAASPAGK